MALLGTLNGPPPPNRQSVLTLMAFMTGEMHCIPTASASWFHLPRGGGVGYAAQEPWIQNMTIKVGTWCPLSSEKYD